MLRSISGYRAVCVTAKGAGGQSLCVTFPVRGRVTVLAEGRVVELALPRDESRRAAHCKSEQVSRRTLHATGFAAYLPLVQHGLAQGWVDPLQGGQCRALFFWPKLGKTEWHIQQIGFPRARCTKAFTNTQYSTRDLLRIPKASGFRGFQTCFGIRSGWDDFGFRSRGLRIPKQVCRKVE